MTPREALDKALKELCGIDYHEVKEALLPLVEKSEPKMVVIKKENIFAQCPVCGNQPYDRYENETKFCPHCGQALDWEGK